ncbi:MAG: hypothetical protein ACTH1D_00530 [Mycobacteriaceae bacterium]|uniref:hypothetical protein n=1 Tax=Corynebacterium sp. TaxID=1720 RepID=UPI003F9534D5
MIPTNRTTTDQTNTSTTAPTPKTPAICAFISALMVSGGFAMLAVVPVVLTLASTLWNARSRPLRWWAAGLTALYASGLLIWALRDDPAQSLTKDLHPALAVLIVLAALAVVVRYILNRRASRA